MKKIFAIIMVLAVALTMSTVAFAENFVSVPATSSREVTVTVKAAQEDETRLPPAYYILVNWESQNATYDVNEATGKIGTWNPAHLEYEVIENPATGEWLDDELPMAKVEIINASSPDRDVSYMLTRSGDWENEVKTLSGTSKGALTSSYLFEEYDSKVGTPKVSGTFNTEYILNAIEFANMGKYNPEYISSADDNRDMLNILWAWNTQALNQLALNQMAAGTDLTLTETFTVTINPSAAVTPTI